LNYGLKNLYIHKRLFYLKHFRPFKTRFRRQKRRAKTVRYFRRRKTGVCRIRLQYIFHDEANLALRLGTLPAQKLHEKHTGQVQKCLQPSK